MVTEVLLHFLSQHPNLSRSLYLTKQCLLRGPVCLLGQPEGEDRTVPGEQS